MTIHAPAVMLLLLVSVSVAATTMATTRMAATGVQRTQSCR
jgi:hypothetical protein